MHRSQPVEQWSRKAAQLRFRQPRVDDQQVLERLAALVVHHHVRGAIRLEIADHAHDVRVAELGERARFLQEAVKPPLVVVLLL